MSYQVIARKYRPQRFEDVVGQEHVTQTLSQAIAQNRIAHAYLFCGPRGTGKTTVARIFAKCLRCVKGPTASPCGECDDCRAIMEGSSLDMLEFDAASNTQVEKIRDIIIDQVKYAPATGQFKLYLVDEVHMLSASSFNALLKTLEEPPAHVKFLFATTDPEKLPATILSRCQRFDLRRIPVALIVKQLRHIAREEQVNVEDAALHAIARGCDGGMRDAESALDQLISFCGNQIVESDVLSMYGLTAQGQLLALSQAILSGDAAAALRELDTLARTGKDLGRLVTDLLRHFRNLLICQVVKDDTSLLEASESEAAALAKQAAVITPEAVTRIMEVFTHCELNLRDAASKKILIEVALLKAIQARSAVNLDAVLRQLNQLRSDAPPTGGLNAAPMPVVTPAAASAATAVMNAPALLAQGLPPVPASAPRPVVHPAPSTGEELRGEALEALWAKLVEGAQRASPFLRSYLLEAHPVAFANRVLTIGFDPEFSDHVSLVDNLKNHNLLQTKMQELGHPSVQIKFVLAEAPAGRAPLVLAEAPTLTATPAPAATPTPPRPKARAGAMDMAEFKNDPLIQKALEIFRGTIVDARV